MSSWPCPHCREAIALNEGHYRALKLLGSALYALGDLPAARAALEASLALNLAYADASCDLGACTQLALLQLAASPPAPGCGGSLEENARASSTLAE
jgi:hypothetical protein